MTQKHMVVWKVVECSAGYWWSCAHVGNPTVGYRIGRVTRRPEGCGPLAAFKRLRQARKFVLDTARDNGHGLEILRCTARESADDTLWFSEESFGEMRVRKRTQRTLPDGTILCDTITPIARVRVR